MALEAFLPSPWLFALGVIVLVSSVGVLAVSKGQREAVLDRIHFHRRRASGASTPPRSISPSKKSSTSVSECPDYSTILPPSRRPALAELSKNDPKFVKGPEPSATSLLKQILPMDRSYFLENDVPTYTPTGFSTVELKSMGDFPAYNILSGVPLPEAYEKFEPTKALPRPYRPLRWAYHQTMSFTKMKTDWWLEVENSYIARVKERQDLFKKYGSKVLDYLPGSELVCKELIEMCLQFYCARYPSYFSLSPDNKVFHNQLLGTETEINQDPIKPCAFRLRWSDTEP